MPDKHSLQSAADLLWQLWQEGRRMPSLPPELRPATREQGYAIQARLEARSAQPVAGWKIAATSAAGQAHIRVDGPIAGRLLAERGHADGATLSLAANFMRMAECEFAFRMARELAPRAAPYRRDEVLAAVDTLHPAIEIPDSRFDPFEQVGAAQLIADNACTGDYIIGAAAPSTWRAIDLSAHAVSARVTNGAGRRGAGQVFTGSGANVLGDPLVALTWLANELSGLGIPFKAGQTVITGTCIAPIPVQPGDHVSADFGSIGTVAVRFS